MSIWKVYSENLEGPSGHIKLAFNHFTFHYCLNTSSAFHLKAEINVPKMCVDILKLTCAFPNKLCNMCQTVILNFIYYASHYMTLLSNMLFYLEIWHIFPLDYTWSNNNWTNCETITICQHGLILCRTRCTFEQFDSSSKTQQAVDTQSVS